MINQFLDIFVRNNILLLFLTLPIRSTSKRAISHKLFLFINIYNTWHLDLLCKLLSLAHELIFGIC